MSVLFPNIFETKQYFFVLDFSVLHLLDFVSLIFFPDVDDFSCGCFLFSCFFPFDICFHIFYSVLKMNLFD